MFGIALHSDIWAQCEALAVATVQGSQLIRIDRETIFGCPVIQNDQLATSGVAAVVMLFLNAAWIHILTYQGLRLSRVPHQTNPHLGIRMFYWANMDVMYVAPGAGGTPRTKFAVQVNSRA